jgi:beta-phosphoglucomutase-like phosphatase (HAD superfamily)
LACEKIGVEPERAYAIEDSYNGIRAAHAGNLRPIMVPDLLPSNEEMEGLAETVLSNLNDAVGYLGA